MKKLFVIFTCFVFIGIQQSKATIFYVDVVLGSDFYNGLFQLPGTAPEGPFATINFAVLSASAGDTIIVAAGEYPEQVKIDKPLVLWGAQQGVKPISSSRGFGLESVLIPQVSDITSTPGSQNWAMWVNSDSVQVDGFSFDGDNTGLTTGKNLNGTDPDLSYGIVVWGLFRNVSIVNSIVVNYYETLIFGYSGLGAAVNNQIRDCFLFNCGVDAIHLESNYYSQVSDNIVDQSPKGIYLNSYSVPIPGTYEISDNWLNITDIAIEIDLLANSGLWQIRQNHIQTDGSNPFFIGIYIYNTSLLAKISFNDNFINGGFSGYYLEDNLKSKLSITNDTLSMNTYGIYSENNQNIAITDTLEIDQVVMSQNNSAGIFCTSDSVQLILKCKDVKISNSNNGVHVAGKVEWLAGNTAFNIILGNFIILDSNANSKRAKLDIDATFCTFEGKTGAVMTGNEGIITEDKIFHYMDRKGLAYVNFKTNNVFVTNSSGNDNLTAGIVKLTDNGVVHISGGTTSEDVIISKNLTFTNYGTVQIGIITMLGTAKRLKLIGDINLSGGLVLSDGFIESNPGNAVHLLTSASISGGSPVSFVDGILYRKASGTGKTVLSFTVGKGTDYRPADLEVTFGAASGVTEFSLEMFNGIPPSFALPAGVKNVSQIRYWLSQVYKVANISEVKYKLSYGTVNVNDQVSQPANLRVLWSSVSGGPYIDLGGTGTSAPNGTITSSVASAGFGIVALGNINGGTNLLGKPGPISIFSWQRGCQNDSTIFTDLSVDLNNVTAWAWDFGDPALTDDTSTASNPFYIYQDTGFFVARLIVTNGFGQKDTSYQTVRITDNPVPFITYVSPCFPNAISFDDSGSVNIGIVALRVWKIDGKEFFGKNVAYGFADSGTYTVELVSTSSFGCTDSVQETIVYGKTPNVIISPSDTSFVCIGDTVTLSSTNTHLSYEWNSGEFTTKIERDQTGIAILTVSSSKNCFASDTAFVQIVPLPIANAGYDTLIYAGTAAFLHGSGGVSYLWSPAEYLDDETSQNPVARPKLKVTGYNLKVTDQYGCVANDSMYVTLNEPDFIKIPNMVTPNDDGQNDTWDLSAVPDIENSKVVILDRWGGLLLETENYKHNWKGRFEDKDLPEGTYIYIIKLKTYNTEVKGNLLLIR
jgi:gliding motility-associated-like protein